MIIRRASAGDAETVARRVSALLIELYPDLTHEYEAVRLVPIAAGLLASDKVIGLIAETDDGESVGVLMLNECEAIYALGRFGEISELYVDAAHRSTGAGHRLVEAAVDIARERRWSMLEVGAPDVPRWERSVDFYKRNGFAEVGPRLYRVL